MTPRVRITLAAIVVSTLAVVAYYHIFLNDFAWDDGYLVLDNPSIRDLAGVPGLFVQRWAQGVEFGLGQAQNSAYFRPVALASMAVDWAIAGGPNPVVFHATNLVIHLLAAVFVLLWVRRILEADGRSRDSGGDRTGTLWAGGIALLWVLQPAHTEAVAIVSYRTTLLSGAATFAVLLAFTGRVRPWRTVLAMVAFAVGLLSKETALVAPGLLAVQDAIMGWGEPRQRPSLRSAWTRAWTVYAPLGLVAACYLWLRNGVVGSGVFSYFDGLTGPQAAMMVPRVFFLYVRLSLIPHPLCPFYDWTILGAPTSWLESDVIAGTVLLAGSIAAVPLFWRRVPLLAFGIAFFLVALLPVSHLVPFFDAAGDRFLYVPVAGVFLGLAGAARAVEATSRLRVAGVIGAAALALVFGGLTAVRAAEWRSSESILRATARDFPVSVSAHIGLGRLLLEQDRPSEAIAPLTEVTRLAPSLAVGHGLLSVAHARAGSLAQSARVLERAPRPQDGLSSAAEIARGELLKHNEHAAMQALGLWNQNSP